MALRKAQGQRGKYLTLELSSTRNLVEDMCTTVSKFQSAKIGDYVWLRRCAVCHRRRHVLFYV
jgi:hypothetical protein